jgi:hypothetical protein
MMGEHENRLMIHGVITPPTSPALIKPGTADWSEHIPAHNPGAYIVETPRGKIVIDPGLAAWGAEQLRLKRASSQCPSMKGSSADAKRVLEALIRACREAINRNGEAFNTESGHLLVFADGVFWQGLRRPKDDSE